MEQLISAATMPYIASAILFTLGTAFLGSILIFIVGGTENTKKRIKIIIALFIVGMPMLASGFYCKSIYDKYSNQAKSIVKNVIAKEYPDATEFEFELGEGYFVENGINYEFEYQKNISGKEKLIVINDKQIKTLDIPKETKNNEPTND
ncbi:hypothetical protein ERE_33880 [Agathobacter rectalis M104/1]|uniref:hypothetical protein n=1 Tax=Agathobacter rectalis TaxID=39491 RepID=UPI0001CD0D54|nr:hypothetical protein [Agathobacter rectalis]CBK95134.1 hypothetical protein ERE_33880 [Agathobacter rectalis M104/1]